MIKISNATYSATPKINTDYLAKCLDTVLDRKDLGFLDLPNRQPLWDSAKTLAHQIKSDYEHIVVVGFGGSSMTAQALIEMTNTKNITVLDNVDINFILLNLKNLTDLKKTAWVFISKSGNTIEVLALIDFLDQYLQKFKINLFENSFFITEQKSNPLYNTALKHQRPCLELPTDVGGRFSALSPSGMLIASLCGLDINLIKQGAVLALADKKNILSLSNQYISSFNDNKNISLFWFYNSSMRWFGGWLQQLWAESLGKKHNRNNLSAHVFSTPMIAIGSSDQHSILQQVMDGEKNKFVTFFRFYHIENAVYQFEKSDFNETKILLNKKFGTLIKAQAQGTAQALQENKAPQVTLEIENLDELNIGYLFMLFQLVVATLAEYHDVDAFDQPGVQLGKIKTLEKLKNF